MMGGQKAVRFNLRAYGSGDISQTVRRKGSESGRRINTQIVRWLITWQELLIQEKNKALLSNLDLRNEDCWL